MLQSVCIKTNNKKVLNYLLKKIDNVDFTVSENKFKVYNNIIVHCYDLDSFYDQMADYITDSIVDFYEADLVKKIINTNYFYFSDSEKSSIYKNTIKSLKEDVIQIKGTIFVAVLSYILENKVILLDGFINFRLKDYMDILDNTVDIAVDNFLVQREYYEFVNLLKIYIDSKKSTVNRVHLIYNNQEAMLLDEYANIITIDDNLLNAKYLSDITFSKNDYVLNTLLTMLPENIIVHLLDVKDEFINTIELIFDTRVSICSTCSLCNQKRVPHHAIHDI